MLFGLSFLQLKIGAVVLLLAVAFWYIRHRETAAYDRGQKAGVAAGWSQAEEQQKTQWEAERAAIAAERDAAAADQRDAAVRRAEVDQARSRLAADLTKRLNDIESANVRGKIDVEKINSSELVPAVRSALAGLAAVDAQRAKDRRPR